MSFLHCVSFDLRLLINHFYYFMFSTRNVLGYFYIMKRKFKQWWSALPPIWTKWTLTSHLKLLIIEKTTTYGVGNPCGGAKCVKGIPIIPLLIIKSKTTMHIFLCRMSNTNMCNIFKDIGCLSQFDIIVFFNHVCVSIFRRKELFFLSVVAGILY